MILGELITLEHWLPIELDIFDRGTHSIYLSTSDPEKHEFSVIWIQISCNNDVIKCGPQKKKNICSLCTKISVLYENYLCYFVR